MSRFTITAIADNVPGVLQRLSIVFTRRKINIDSVTVSETPRTGTSRFTFVVRSDADTVEKVLAQMRKVVELREVYGHCDEDLIFTEIALVRLRASAAEERDAITVIARDIGARVCSFTPEGVVLELSGSEDEIDSGVSKLSFLRIEELVRSGRIAIALGLNGPRQLD